MRTMQRRQGGASRVAVPCLGKLDLDDTLKRLHGENETLFVDRRREAREENARAICISAPVVRLHIFVIVRIGQRKMQTRRGACPCAEREKRRAKRRPA